VNKDF
jgi:hypothetical protein